MKAYAAWKNRFASRWTAAARKRLPGAETFLNRAIRQALSALSQALKRTAIEEQYVEALRASAQEAQRQILTEKQTAYAKVRSVSSMTQDLQNLERQLWSSMPPAVKAMLDFSANSRARGS